MSQIGITKERIAEILSSRGINAGESPSAGKLKQAIAEVVDENNREIEKKIEKKIGDYIVRNFMSGPKRPGTIK